MYRRQPISVKRYYTYALLVFGATRVSGKKLPILTVCSTLPSALLSFCLTRLEFASGLPPELPFIYFLACGTGANLRRDQSGNSPQGFPHVAYFYALQGVPRFDTSEWGQDDQRAAKGFEGEESIGRCKPCKWGCKREGRSARVPIGNITFNG